MNVYLVSTADGGPPSPESAWSSEEKAQAEIERLRAEWISEHGEDGYIPSWDWYSEEVDPER